MRPLRRYLQHTVETLLARRIVEGNVSPGATLRVEVRDDAPAGRLSEFQTAGEWFFASRLFLQNEKQDLTILSEYVTILGLMQSLPTRV